MKKFNLKRVAAVAASLMLISVAFAGMAYGAPETKALAGGVIQEAYAADNTYTTPAFDTEIIANEDNTFDIEEHIAVDFKSPHHGIYRYVPLNGVKISNVEVPGYDYETSHEGGNYLMKIGSADYTLKGRQDYTIRYKMSAWDDMDDEKDVLMLNLIPTDWQTPIDSASVVIHLPKAIDADAIHIYSGTYGTSSNECNAAVRVSRDGKTIRVSARNMEVYNGITITADLPEGYWVGERHKGDIEPWMIILFLFGPLACFPLWIKFGRDEHIVKTVEFYPPDDLTPGEIGYLYDGNLDKRDLVSSIVYLANKGCLSIDEMQTRNGKKTYVLTKIREPYSKEPDYVSDIFYGLFRKKTSVRIDQLGTAFGVRYQKAQERLTAMYSGSAAIVDRTSRMLRFLSAFLSVLPVAAVSAWLTCSGDYTGWALIFISPIPIWLGEFFLCRAVDEFRWRSKLKTGIRIALACFFLKCGIDMTTALSIDVLAAVPYRTNLMISWALTAAVLVGAMFTAIMPRRNSRYTKTLGRILGFRDFIATAELDKLKELVEEDPKYFYNISPYAYVMGLSDRWIKNFEDIPTGAPDWYAGEHIDTFDAYRMGYMMHHFNSDVSHNIKIPQSHSHGGGGGSSSGGSSSSGGGFTGCGMGGGGGGAW